MAQLKEQYFKNQRAAFTVSLALIVVFLVTARAERANAALFNPWVQTGQSTLSGAGPNGRHVSVNVPLVFHMDLDTRGGSNGAKLDLNVLFGLVRVNLDRERGSDGRFHGPINVSVGGLTMYDDGEGPLPTNGTDSQTNQNGFNTSTDNDNNSTNTGANTETGSNSSPWNLRGLSSQNNQDSQWPTGRLDSLSSSLGGQNTDGSGQTSPYELSNAE